MPDWFYCTVSRPLLFSLPPKASRDFTLRFLGALARLPLGPQIIDFLGHMRADSRLRCSYSGVDFPIPVGLGPYLDGDAVALPALARFGLGFVEVGPVSIEPVSDAGAIERPASLQALRYPESFRSGPGLKMLERRLAAVSLLGLPLIARLGARGGMSPQDVTKECCCCISELAPHVHLFSLATLGYAVDAGWSQGDWKAHLQGVVSAAQQHKSGDFSALPVLLCVPADADDARTRPLIEAAIAAGVGGFVVDGSIAESSGGRVVGLPAREPALRQVRALRQRWGSDLLLIASGGVHEPEHALELRAAGADLVQVDSGMVYSGPGLPKRINDALLYQICRQKEKPQSRRETRPAAMTWFWTALMGGGMLWGSVLALVIAATRIVLPYDESFVGMSREQLAAVNPRLLPFMAHDRVSLAGTMVAVGALYLGLSLFGIRRGLHWAQKSVFVSALAGFAGFFLFLGYGYLDPFHAFVTACLLHLLLLGVHSRLGKYRPERQEPPHLRESAAWRRNLWGQFLLILHSIALIGAGLVISVIGVTSVFVPEDLMFMQTTAEALQAANPRLVPLVAHDRATLGAMLLSSGLGFLLPALWGYRNGSRWLWWTFLLAGLSAYAAAIGAHMTVRYTDAHHLMPAFAGLALFLTALGLSHPYLCSGNHESDEDWKRFLPEERQGSI